MTIKYKKFYTITNLQGSQTWQLKQLTKLCFTPLQTYKVLKLNILFHCKIEGFTPLQTYKVLKQRIQQQVSLYGFTPLQTYKVLKLL